MLSDEIKNENESSEVVDVEENYAETLLKLKQNSVSREKYEKAVSENKKLLDAIYSGKVDGLDIKQPVESKSIEELREAWRKEDQTNLEYAINTLALRKAIIEETGKDPFLPYGEKISPTREDVEGAEKVAQVFQECIDYADGDSEIFTNELMRRTANSNYIKRK